MSVVAALSGPLQTVWTVVLCILLTLAELLIVALIVAPRRVAGKLLSVLRALTERAATLLGAGRPRGQPGHPSREGT